MIRRPHPFRLIFLTLPFFEDGWYGPVQPKISLFISQDEKLFTGRIKLILPRLSRVKWTFEKRTIPEKAQLRAKIQAVDRKIKMSVEADGYSITRTRRPQDSVRRAA